MHDLPITALRLLHDTGRRDEARAIMQTSNNWFTEGFDTVERRDAKALFDELNNRMAQARSMVALT